MGTPTRTSNWRIFITLVGFIASCIGIFTFITGKMSISDLLGRVGDDKAEGLGANALPVSMSPTHEPARAIPTSVIATFTPKPQANTPRSLGGLVSGATRIWEKDGMVQVYVPAGEFLMGSTEADSAATTDEKPQHKTYLDAFWIDRNEVTNVQFAAFAKAASYLTDAEKAGTGLVFNASTKDLANVAGADWRRPRGPSSNTVGLENHPVVQVSWNDASSYCEWAGRRLPTEAEWEKAARGGDGGKYPWGNGGVAGNLLNFADSNLDAGWADKGTNDGYQFTAPVGCYQAGASPYGALDMAGNVSELVADWADGKYYVGSPEQNPTGPASGTFRVLRGGGWFYSKERARAAYRDGIKPDKASDGIGFRCSSSY